MERGCYRLFVGGLPVRAQRDSIIEFFSKYGTVLSLKLKINQSTGRSLGFAYLNIREKQAYDQLLNQNIVFQGRVIEVKPQWNRKELTQKLEEEKNKKIFVSNLPADITNQELASYFEKFGEVKNAFVIKDPDTLRNKNYGYIIFMESETIEQAFLYRHSHFIRPGIEVRLERCLNSSEISKQKQGPLSKDYKMADKYYPKYSDYHYEASDSVSPNQTLAQTRRTTTSSSRCSGNTKDAISTAEKALEKQATKEDSHSAGSPDTHSCPSRNSGSLFQPSTTTSASPQYLMQQGKLVNARVLDRILDDESLLIEPKYTREIQAHNSPLSIPAIIGLDSLGVDYGSGQNAKVLVGQPPKNPEQLNSKKAALQASCKLNLTEENYRINFSYRIPIIGSSLNRRSAHSQ